MTAGSRGAILFTSNLIPLALTPSVRWCELELELPLWLWMYWIALLGVVSYRSSLLATSVLMSLVPSWLSGSLPSLPLAIVGHVWSGCRFMACQ